LTFGIERSRGKLKASGSRLVVTSPGVSRLGEGQRERRQEMRRMKKPADRLSSEAGVQNYCDDGLMRLICPTCQIGQAKIFTFRNRG